MKPIELHSVKPSKSEKQIIQSFCVVQRCLLQTRGTQKQIRGLGDAVGKETAAKLFCGCEVHRSHSWQCISDCVCNSILKNV